VGVGKGVLVGGTVVSVGGTVVSVGGGDESFVSTSDCFVGRIEQTAQESATKHITITTITTAMTSGFFFTSFSFFP
jgi:hypothetical protein